MTALKGGTYGPGHSDFCNTKASNTKEELIKDLPPEEDHETNLLLVVSGR